MSKPIEAIAEFKKHVKALAKESQSDVSFVRIDCSMPGMMTVSMQYGLTPSAVKGVCSRKEAGSPEHVYAGVDSDITVSPTPRSAERSTGTNARTAPVEAENGEVAGKHDDEAQQQPAGTPSKPKRSMMQMSNAEQVELIEKLLMKWRHGEVDV